MRTVYGLTNEHGQIVYVGQTGNMQRRWWEHGLRNSHIPMAGVAVLGNAKDAKTATAMERKWILYFGVDNLFNKVVVEEDPTTKIYVRVTDVLRGKLIQDAGDMSSVSTVIRTILEQHYAKKVRR